MDNFARDPLANSIAVVVLVFMIVTLIAVVLTFLKESRSETSIWPKWSVPLLATLGLAVSGYLLYVEWSGADAVCGPTGDCNAVQDSPYAKLFGIVPVGLLGVAGYIFILVAWLIAEYGNPARQKLFHLLVWGMSLFGVAFSIYLTFLEPFVIGATCMWCITSAILITLILIASTGPARMALSMDEGEPEDAEFSEI